MLTIGNNCPILWRTKYHLWHYFQTKFKNNLFSKNKKQKIVYKKAQRVSCKLTSPAYERRGEISQTTVVVDLKPGQKQVNNNFIINK